MLMDLSTMKPMPKVVRPIEHQETFESRKLWEGVTSTFTSFSMLSIYTYAILHEF